MKRKSERNKIIGHIREQRLRMNIGKTVSMRILRNVDTNIRVV
jgi:hypothetical protein